MPDPLAIRLKALIVTKFRLDGLRPEDIADDERLIGSPCFGLDSLDGLELGLVIEQEFGVSLGNHEESHQALASVRTLAAYLRSRSAGGRTDTSA